MWRRFLIGLGGWLGGVALVLLSVTTTRADEPPEMRMWQMGPRQIITLGGRAEIKPSDYWLGLGFYPVEAALRAQLNLPEGQGLLVEQVVPDSPAATTGIEKYDVLVKAGDKPLKNVQDLIDAVDASKDKELTLGLFRGGKPMTIKVKPVKRPEGPPRMRPPTMPQYPGWERFYEWFEDRRPDEEGKPAMRFRFFHPGAILPHGARDHPPLPGNLSITIHKKGEEPAKIKVQRDDKKWEVTEDELDELPEDIRPHVGRMLGRFPSGPMGRVESFDFDFFPKWARPHVELDVTPKSRAEGRLEKRLEEMNRRIEQLRKSIDQMRKSSGESKTPEKHQKDPSAREKQESI